LAKKGKNGAGSPHRKGKSEKQVGGGKRRGLIVGQRGKRKKKGLNLGGGKRVEKEVWENSQSGKKNRKKKGTHGPLQDEGPFGRVNFFSVAREE